MKTSPENIHAAIIAGGKSRRMGRTKALLEIDGEPLIARVASVVRRVLPNLLVVTSSPEIAAAAHAPQVLDIFPGKGPLAGIHAALKNAGAPVFCCACDMPHLNVDFIRYLGEKLDGYDAVIPRAGRFLEPLHAIYTPACLPVIEAELQGKAGPMEQAFRGLRVLYVGEDEAKNFDIALRMFDNWNTPDDVKKESTHENPLD